MAKDNQPFEDVVSDSTAALLLKSPQQFVAVFEKLWSNNQQQKHNETDDNKH
jgi:hypothetical protein